MKTLLALTALAGAAWLMPAPAAAASDIIAVERPVQHTDLDLGTAKGRRTLDQRIAIAVRTACGDASSVDPEGARFVRKCRSDALARAAEDREIAVAAASSERGKLAARAD